MNGRPSWLKSVSETPRVSHSRLNVVFPAEFMDSVHDNVTIANDCLLCRKTLACRSFDRLNKAHEHFSAFHSSFHGTRQFLTTESEVNLQVSVCLPPAGLTNQSDSVWAVGLGEGGTQVEETKHLPNMRCSLASVWNA